MDYTQNVAHATYMSFNSKKRATQEIADTKMILVKDVIDIVDEVIDVKDVFRDVIKLYVKDAKKQIEATLNKIAPRITVMSEDNIKKLPALLDRLLQAKLEVDLHGLKNKMTEYEQIQQAMTELHARVKELEKNIPKVTIALSKPKKPIKAKGKK